MSADTLKKYADLYAGADVLCSLSPDDAGAFLLSGEDGDGLAVLARLVAAKLAGLPSSRAFDEFADIITYPVPQEQRAAKGKKTDPSRRPTLTVDDVRDITDSLYLTPFELDRRFYILENAETMSEICQNKMLKSLEEPPRSVCFILCATRALLPTVESRCRTLRLPPFDIGTVEEALSRHHSDKNAVRLAARASRGNLGLAEKMVGDREFGATYRSAVDILTSAKGSRVFARTAALYDKFTREKTDAVLGIMEYLLCDVARQLSGLTTVFDAADVTAIADGFTPLSAANSAERVREAKRRNDSNCMPVAVLDGLVLKIMEEKALCHR